MLPISYESHGVWGSLKELEDHLIDFSDKKDERFADLNKKTQFLRWVLEKSDPMLISAQNLEYINRQLQDVIRLIWDNANNWGNFSHIEEQFTQIFQIISYPRIQKIFKTDANSFFAECETKVNTLLAETEKQAVERLETVNADVTAVADAITELQTNFANLKSSVSNLDTAIEASNSNIESQFDTWETRLDQQIAGGLSEISETFSQGQTSRSEDHVKLLDKISDLLRTAQANTDKTLSVNEKQISQAEATMKAWHEESVAEANDILTKINNIYGVAGNNALSGDFSKTAEKEESSYKWQTLFASMFYIAAPVIYFLLLFSTDTSEFRVVDYLARIPIAAIFFAPAIYFGNLAQKHRRISIAFRSLGLRIATFDAYLANFGEADKVTEKIKMSEVFFDAKISDSRESAISNKDVGKAIDQMLGTFEKVAKLVNKKDK